MREHKPLIAVLLILVFIGLTMVFAGTVDDGNKRDECVANGGTWLPKNGQCVFK